jgi:hypothetical protein
MNENAWVFVGIGVLLLLAAAAGAFFFVSASSASSFHVQLHNRGEAPIEDVRLTWPTGEEDLGRIDPGGMCGYQSWGAGEGAVEVRYRVGDAWRRGVLVGYVTSGPEASVSVDLGPDWGEPFDPAAGD